MYFSPILATSALTPPAVNVTESTYSVFANLDFGHTPPSFHVQKHQVRATILVSLLDVVYLLIIDYLENPNKPAAPDTKAEIKTKAPKAISKFGHDLPALRDSINAAISGRSKAEQLAILGHEIKDALPTYTQENYGFTREELEVLKSAAHYLRSDSEVALNKLKKFASITRDPFVTSKLTPKTSSQSGHRSQLEALVQKLVGRKDSTLTPEESAVVRDMQPEAYKQYLALRRNFNQVWKDFIVAYIRKSGKHTVPYQELLAALDQQGLDHLLCPGFTGQIDDRGRLYTSLGELIDGAPNAVTFASVTMNKGYGKNGGGDWVFKAIRYDGSDGPYYYTAAFKRAQAKQKFERVAVFDNKVEGMRKKWVNELKKFDMDNPKSICALILELLYTFSARIGSAKNATEGSPTFGISTLLVKHAKLEPNGGIVLRYKGKGGVPTVHKIMPSDQIMRIMAKALHELIEGKDPKDPIFTIPTRRGLSRISGQMVNNYFRALGAGDVTVHKLRTLRGTRLFRDLAQKLHESGKKPRNDAEAKAYLTKMATAVGKELNHVRSTSTGLKVTPATAIANYIDPTAIASVFRDWGFRPPAVVEKLLGSHGE